MSALDKALVAAHDAGDASALVALYCKAADAAETVDATAFFLTHAHIFALEAGHADTDKLRARLIEMGRESALQPPLPPNR